METSQTTGTNRVTINEREFNQLCQDAHAELKSNTRQTARYAAIVEAVFPRLCTFLGLDPARQRNELGGDCGFLVLQTIEENMKPAFDCSTVLKAYV